VIAHVSIQSPETVLKHIESDGKYEFDLRGEKIVVTKEHLIIERVIPAPYVESEIKAGQLYLNPEMTDELEAEGYAREVMRRVQSLRKKAGLEKQDSIVLFVKVDEELKDRLLKWEEQIKQKCGADKIRISEQDPAKKHEFASKEKIKEYEFLICFDKD
jgi:isoleucyl-tRNA synthetase